MRAVLSLPGHLGDREDRLIVVAKSFVPDNKNSACSFAPIQSLCRSLLSFREEEID
jgi:hypothetical protein